MNNALAKLIVTFNKSFSTHVLGYQLKHLGKRSCVLSSRSLNLSQNPSATTTTTRQLVPPTTSRSTTMKPPNPDLEGWRIPKNVYKPISYDLTLRPYLDSGKFNGTIKIKFEVNSDLDVIKLNSNGLTITDATIKFINDTQNDFINCIASIEEKEIATIRCTRPNGGAALKPGIHHIEINFKGNMTDRIVGLYRSSYENEDGKTRYIATSKLEPTYARQAFPCFDEPNYKANYTVHLQIPKGDGYIALSNMDQNGEPEDIPGDNNHQMVHFNRSVPMSTYVSCFIVCDFDYTNDTIKSTSGKDIPLRVYATPAQVNKTQYALSIAKKVTEYYETYFDIPYPLPKLDMIAIPDFVSGAMEHWGLVTYRETALLFDKASSSAANQQRVATVVAHELAHMWFGNLVTLDWWNDLWLNEGFATYMQFKAIHELIPDWGMADQFLIDQLHSVLEFDSTLATHPIVVSVTTPNQITEIFDSISYNKGASMLRMIENAIGEDKFKEGIHKYLKAHAYGNAVTKDLWKELQDTVPDASLNVQEVMDTWTVQPGYPLITISSSMNTNKTKIIYTLKQQRFYIDSNAAESNPKGYKWTIPITYFTDKDPKDIQIVWFKKDSPIVSIELPLDIKWVKFNERQVGYYRVNYVDGLWRNLTSDFENLSAADKTNLLEDSFSIAKSGDLQYHVPLEMTLKMKSETEYVPWTVTIRKFNQLKPLMKSDYDVYEKFKKHVLSVLDNIYKKLGWATSKKAEEGHQDKLLRAKILDAACAYGLEDCKSKAKERFEEWLKSGKVDLEEKALVYEYGMEDVLKPEWEKVFDIYMNETDAAEKLKLLNGLASVKNIDILNILLDRAKNENVVRSQDYFTCLQYISYNDYGTELVWNYVREHWEELVERFTLNDRYLGRLIPAITSRFVTETKLSEMEAFFAKYPDAGAGETSRKQALEKVQNNIKWIENYYKQVKDWLSSE